MGNFGNYHKRCSIDNIILFGCGGYVLETGRVVLAGSATALLCDEGVKQAYIGKTPTAPPRDERLLIGA